MDLGISHLGNDEIVLLKQNPALHLAADANLTITCAEQAAQDGEREKENSFSRISILMHFMAFEGALNFTYTYSEVPPSRWTHYSIGEKWTNLANDCLPMHGIIQMHDTVVYRPGDPIVRTSADAKLQEDFLEFKRVRNLLVHLKPQFRAVVAADVDASLDEPINSASFPKLSSGIQQLGVAHSYIARDIYRRLIERLKACMMGVMDDPLETIAMVEHRTAIAKQRGWPR